MGPCDLGSGLFCEPYKGLGLGWAGGKVKGGV